MGACDGSDNDGIDITPLEDLVWVGMNTDVSLDLSRGRDSLRDTL